MNIQLNGAFQLEQPNEQLLEQLPNLNSDLICVHYSIIGTTVTFKLRPL